MKAAHRSHSIRRIISGGQTGVDRGALDAAIALGIEHGGWCPRGRMAEDGRIPARYKLKETESPEYRVRTELNVMNSDGTLILYYEVLTGGSELTRRLTLKHGKPRLLVDLKNGLDQPDAHTWLSEYGIAVLNVAGPRESTAPGITKLAREFVSRLLGGEGKKRRRAARKGQSDRGSK
jgi:hypothetical protein